MAALCAQEHSQALEVKAVQDARTGEIAGRVKSDSRWCSSPKRYRFVNRMKMNVYIYIYESYPKVLVSSVDYDDI